MPYSFELAAQFDIRASTGTYGVGIEPRLIDRLISGGGEQVFIVDDYLKAPLLAAGLDPILIVADENAKSLDRMTDIIVQLRDRRATRGTTLVAVGGGVVQDIAAFAASIYMRGIDWIYVPTTLLSMTDSCIGGKSSINVGKYKNIVGTFHPPVQVLIDPTFIATLDTEQKAAGLCEAAKISLCRGLDEFDAYAALDPSVEGTGEALMPVIERSLRAKKWFVEVDEFDQNERLILNFGHTFGHAIEAATGFAVSHGIAVGLGMIAALELGEAMGRDYSGIPQIARFRAHVDTLVAAPGDLSASLAGATPARLMDAFVSDKKHTRDRYAVIVVTDDGTVERTMLPRNAATETLIERAYDRMLAPYKMVTA